ncbi:4'-phosphopantetheinyl transferase superfamily protein [Streptomyces sp. 71268]|uniref:4'-phosphopantetheinyl transferase family protein n=1 Tax=Streptomyces sp. 71268 TaxID=3002640 RepID=UPI0023F93503|nr:4'-phosphopantetheinyl transferase superfamily protein [Streptomyces sp. 71268]WEV24534.1 4'-phosphopantetheinyl transferase superfamily protein [Streptomyces sp. 71268]
MTAAESPRPVPPLGPPIEVVGQDTGWDRARAELLSSGAVLLHARQADWYPGAASAAELRTLLGDDWSCYLALAHPDLRMEYAASRMLLRYAAKTVVHGGASSSELGYGPTGRPYLRGCDKVDISLSHADGVMVVGLTTRGLIGVDVERTDRQVYGKGFGRHICTPYELVSLSNLPEYERNGSLIRLWTLKEAYSKAMGQAMKFRFTEVGFAPDGGPVRVRRPDGSLGGNHEWAFSSVVLDSGHRVSAAVFDAAAAKELGRAEFGTPRSTADGDCFA